MIVRASSMIIPSITQQFISLFTALEKVKSLLLFFNISKQYYKICVEPLENFI